MANELALIDKTDAATLVRYGRPLLTLESLVEEGQQRQLLMKYVQAHMVEGTDFGVIPGTKNKTLLKPGAEKLTDLFRCSAEFTIVEKVEDWDKPLIHYVFRCRIVSRETGGVVAEGFGSCNSHESKYRYRNSDRLCPQCSKPTIIVGKKEYGGGFVCFAKKGGCGAKFGDRDPAITGQQLGKVENPDVADVANTILKMAKKRAHVDAAIALARCSDMFTQDAEDMQQGYDEPPPQRMTATTADGKRVDLTPRAVQDAEPPDPRDEQPEDDIKVTVPATMRATGQRWADVMAWINERMRRGGEVEYPADILFGDIHPEDLKAWVFEHTPH